MRVVSVRFSGLLGILGLFGGLDGFRLLGAFGLPCALGFLGAMGLLGLLSAFVLLGLLDALALFGGGREGVEKGG